MVPVSRYECQNHCHRSDVTTGSSHRNPVFVGKSDERIAWRLTRQGVYNNTCHLSLPLESGSTKHVAGFLQSPHSQLVRGLSWQWGGRRFRDILPLIRGGQTTPKIPQKKKTVHLKKFMSNLCWVSDSCHREAGRRSRELFDKVVWMLCYLGVSGFRWGFGHILSLPGSVMAAPLAKEGKPSAELHGWLCGRFTWCLYLCTSTHMHNMPEDVHARREVEELRPEGERL